MPVISHQVPLEQIYELNRLFLRYLQSCKRERMLTLGLPKKAVAPLQEASSGQLEAVAEFPRALFQLVLDDPNPVGGENIFDNASLRVEFEPHLPVALTCRIEAAFDKPDLPASVRDDDG